MKFRVRKGARWRSAGPGAIVDATPGQAAIVPWCLEAVVDDPPAMPASVAEGKPAEDPLASAAQPSAPSKGKKSKL